MKKEILLVIGSILLLFGGAVGAGAILSKQPWVASLELPSLILTGVYLVLYAIYGISSAKRFKGTKFRSFAKKCETVALFVLLADLALETALHLAGI